MPTTTKKWARKKPATKKVRKTTPSKAEILQKDRAERKRISKTLDMEAFLEDFKKDTTSASYWEKPD